MPLTVAPTLDRSWTNGLNPPLKGLLRLVTRKEKDLNIPRDDVLCDFTKNSRIIVDRGKNYYKLCHQWSDPPTDCEHRPCRLQASQSFSVSD